MDKVVCETITVQNKSGLHLRPASELSKIAARCTSEIKIIAGTKEVNPKSVLILMSAGITCGTTVEVQCEGENEKEDLKTIIDAIASGLGE